MPRARKTKPKGTVAALLAQADRQAAEAGVEIEPEAYSLDWYRADWPARKQVFIEREMKIRNAFNRNKLQDFTLNDAQLVLLEVSNEAYEDPSIEPVVLKCRRLGISTYFLADYLSDAIMESGHHVRLVAQDPKTLRALMKALKEMYSNLRPEVKPLQKYDAKTELEFDDPEKDCVGSRVSLTAVVPGHEEEGRGDTITRLHRTEVPFWRGDAETAATALGEAAQGGKTSDESTAKGMGDFFHREYQKGKRGEGGKRAFFFQWWWNRNRILSEAPAGARFEEQAGDWYLITGSKKLDTLNDDERDAIRVSTYTAEEKRKNDFLLQSEYDCAHAIAAHLKIKGYVGADAPWHCPEVATYVAWRRKMIGKIGLRKFRVENPENDVDCFAATGGMIFDPNYVTASVKFREPEPGHEYKVFLDPSNGVEGGDPYYLCVIDTYTGEQVYGEAGLKKQDLQAKRCCEVSDKYNGAEIGIESNMGEAAILAVENLGYDYRLYKHMSPELERDVDEGKLTYREALDRAKAGLPMTERMKRLMINEFEAAWRTKEFKCSDSYMADEAMVFVQDGEKMGAKSGYHDDSIMAGAGCWYLVSHGRIGKAGYKSAGQKLGSAQLSGF